MTLDHDPHPNYLHAYLAGEYDVGSHRVWKYELPLEGQPEVTMPIGAEVLHIGVQGNVPYLWARVDPRDPVGTRRFLLVGTGHPVPDSATHLGTFMLDDGRFVGHVFEARR